MENQPVIPPPPEAAPPRAGVSRGLFVAVSVLSILTFLGLLAFGAMMAAVAVSSSAEAQKAQKRIEALESRVTWLEGETTRFWIAEDMFQFGVTDSLYTNHVLFCADDIVMMDIGVQRSFDSHYEGEGRFNLSDTDLKAELYKMMLELKHSYDSARHEGMADFAALEVRISVYGYDVATYKNDVVTLARGN